MLFVWDLLLGNFDRQLGFTCSQRIALGNLNATILRNLLSIFFQASICVELWRICGDNVCKNTEAWMCLRTWLDGPTKQLKIRPVYSMLSAAKDYVWNDNNDFALYTLSAMDWAFLQLLLVWYRGLLLVFFSLALCLDTRSKPEKKILENPIQINKHKAAKPEKTKLWG